MKTWNILKKNTVSSSSSSGFTLIELIAVIIIIGIVSKTIVVNVGDITENTRLRNAVNIALADLRYSQEMAINKRRQVRFVVQAGANRYYAVYTDNNETVTNSDGQPINRTFNTGDYQDVVISDTETSSNLTFSDVGRPDVGSGYFTDKSVMSLNGGEFEIFIFGSGLSTFQDASGGGCGC